MKVYSGTGIWKFFREEPIPESYLGTKELERIKEFQVLAVLDFENGMMCQSIQVALNPDKWNSLPTSSEVEKLFQDDMVSSVQAVEINFNTKTWLVNLVHYY